MWSTSDVLPWPNPEFPLFYWNIKKSSEEPSPDGRSLLNQGEVFAIAAVIDRLVDKGVEAKSIGIITPYSAQESILIDNLPMICEKADDDYVSDIEISSVDAFQGREKDFIIFSTVRSNDSHSIGFCTDKRRLNVSITRAKYGIVVIGNAETFSESQIWCNFIKSFIDRNCFVEGLLHDLKPSEFEPKPKKDKDPSEDEEGFK